MWCLEVIVALNEKSHREYEERQEKAAEVKTEKETITVIVPKYRERAI